MPVTDPYMPLMVLYEAVQAMLSRRGLTSHVTCQQDITHFTWREEPTVIYVVFLTSLGVSVTGHDGCQVLLSLEKELADRAYSNSEQARRDALEGLGFSE